MQHIQAKHGPAPPSTHSKQATQHSLGNVDKINVDILGNVDIINVDILGNIHITNL
jgi:hypothetical protein